MLEFLPEPMREPTVLAIPFFVTMLAIEWFAAAKLEHDPENGLDGEGGPLPGAYETRDARASVLMGLVSIGTSAFWKLLGLLAYTALFTYVAPWHLPMDQWYSWVIAFVAVDFIYYWVHRVSHRVRIVWATHQAHHSSEYFNFATALRQKWNISAAIVMWLPLPLLGVPPALVFFAYSLNLIYQFWIHTEHIDRMWRPFEYVFNTPSHHRVHHGRDPEYLDRNYGGVFIIWDRMFGSFTPEVRRPRYGLTKPVDTYNIWRLETHEYVAIARDVRSTSNWRARLGYIFGPPGWTPKTGEPAAEPVASGVENESVSPPS
ncbi:sterol desaturase family protein [Gordonia alkanivorans]|uniref:sterol desaturase family protein n=1 Tax=Gordonia alkanivorans TaxID=84096 RepID=UPI0024490874|nr:sterol desaturase family protein [Gordonia alkanivorans]MDH3006176.1 sterol desaturase family protein [Gordonia alkanivorans]MDH3015931.1 sterol desaturase family protein [Gordonia alkanivorans]MDH3040565.1 sterol desaturase family protein [Gordonia alkanivorans]MDH3047519.1 sterol desaturase family protein [Gordonia alkanivorans]MDH3061392.1 sterol desaturase family protein [Gordonia alkanivorans]